MPALGRSSSLSMSPLQRMRGLAACGSCLSPELVFVVDDEAFGYLKRVIVTPAVYPRLVESFHFDIQSTGQKSHCVNTTFWPSQCYVLIRQSDSPCPYQF